MSKGNRTKTNRDTSAINELNRRYKQEVDTYKQFAEARRNKRKYKQETVTLLYDKLTDYTNKCFRENRPMTVAGTILALGIDRDTWYRAKKGELDYLLEEYLIVNNIKEDDLVFVDDLPYFQTENGDVLLIRYSDLCQKADLMIQQRLEENCYSNRGNPAGSIFALKSQFEWREETSPSNLTQTLVIADANQALEALKLLK